MSEYGIWCNFEIIFMFGDRLIETLSEINHVKAAREEEPSNC